MACILVAFNNHCLFIVSIHYSNCKTQLDVKEAKEIVNHPQWDLSEEEEEATKEEDSAVEDSDLLDESDEDDDDDLDEDD